MKEFGISWDEQHFDIVEAKTKEEAVELVKKRYEYGGIDSFVSCGLFEDEYEVEE